MNINKSTPQNPAHISPNNTAQNLILLTVLLAVFVVPSSISGTAIALEFIARSFGDFSQTTQIAQNSNQNQALLQWVVNSFNLCFATFTLIWGALADRFGTRKCLILGVFLYLIGSALSALSPNLITLDIARGIAGLGGASVFACGASILVKSFSEDKRAKVFALFGTTAGLGITLSPTISGLLIDAFANASIAGFAISIENSWRSIFAFHFLVLFVVLLLSLCYQKIRKIKNLEPKRTHKIPSKIQCKKRTKPRKILPIQNLKSKTNGLTRSVLRCLSPFFVALCFLSRALARLLARLR